MPHAGYKREGDHVRQTVSVDLFTAVLGGEKEVSTLSGLLKIKIPPGTQNGKVLRIRGKGMPVYNKPGETGDLLVEIQVLIPEKLTEQQRQLFRQLQSSRTGGQANKLTDTHDRTRFSNRRTDP